MKTNYRDPMSQYASAKKRKVVLPNQQTESKLQTKLCGELRLRYPNLYFQTDFAAGLFMPDHIAAIRASQSPLMKVLDVSIFKARKPYHGLIIELKRDDSSPYLKDGVTLKSNSHLESQQSSIDILLAEGYYACFATGLDEAIKVVEWYLSLPRWD